MAVGRLFRQGFLFSVETDGAVSIRVPSYSLKFPLDSLACTESPSFLDRLLLYLLFETQKEGVKWTNKIKWY